MKYKVYISIVFIILKLFNLKYGIFDPNMEIITCKGLLSYLSQNPDVSKMSAEEYKEFLEKGYETINKERYPDLYDRQPNIPYPPSSGFQQPFDAEVEAAT
jgi:hypothetical protein